MTQLTLTNVDIVSTKQMTIDNDQRSELIEYLRAPSSTTKFKTNEKAIKYVLLDDKLYKQSAEGLLLKCLDKLEYMKVMVEVHEGIYGSYRSGSKMKWLIHRHNYY